ncbi:MAG TPA: class I SAM-dependent methyltransferase family protein [archaeon]|nr:class I SAM-dependent methyltransferase family protein [archaeon]
MALKNLLKNKLTKKELSLAPSSFDIIGGKEKAVAIVEIDDKIKKRRKTIANAIMKQHKNVKSVLLKQSERKGVERLREYKVIAGDKNTEVIHKENNCRFLIDIQKAYFSQREGTERDRIAKLVKKNEVVMVFFAGIGPFNIVISKKSMPKKTIGIEINPEAVRYFWQNIKLNKIENTQIILGDVKERAKEFYGLCNRVLMPLPESSNKFIEEAIQCLKKKGVCHYYCFISDDMAKHKAAIRKTAKKLNRKIKFIGISKVLPYSPGIWKTRVDFEVD